MGTNVGGGGGSLKSEINVTPLVDVVLVLLIVFMVAIPMLQLGYPVATPVEHPGDPSAHNQLIVRLDRAGRTYLNREEVPVAQLGPRLAGMDLSRRMVHVAADGDLPYGDVVDLMDLCRSHGATNLGIVFDELPPAGG
jgi:biopolymer transport protein ExbD